MKKHNHTSESSFAGNGYKNKHFVAQMKRVFLAFKRKPSTMLMVSIETGILRANICRYVDKMKKSNNIHLLKQEVCMVSKHRSGYYTTDTNLFTEPLKLF